MSLNVELKIIGIVKHTYTEEELKNKFQDGVNAIIEMFPEYVPGLKKLEGFSHIYIISWLHRVPKEQREVLLVKPRRLLRYGFKEEELPEIGVFASDSPHRPNPIGISIVKLKRIESNILHVENCDLFNGTPVLDIKPVTKDRVQLENLSFPEWQIRIEKFLREKGLPEKF